MALITCKNASFGYEGKTAVKDVDFRLDSGDYMCIVGENGSGKSTLIKGLLKLRQATEGSVILGDGLLSSEIGYLPQQSTRLKDFPASVFEVVISGRLNSMKRRLFYNAADKKEALSKMSLMGVEDIKNKRFEDLSGGQQQRVLLARALCATKKLLLLDEPAAGLDPVVTAEFYQLIEKLNRENGITIIMVSHDVRAAVKYSTHILHLGHTQLFFGKTEDYVKSELGERFLGGDGNA